MTEDNITNEKVKKPSNSYFAASNGGRGFVSYFDKVFDNDRYEKVYVLKGGPGTGKSSLMKKAAIISKELGYTFEQILCSSDPESLDGIIITKNDQRTAIIDGTAPHVREAMLPGAVDQIVDLGVAWDEKTLAEKRELILKLTEEKKHTYLSAYSILNCAYTLTKRKQDLLRDCIDKYKLKKAISRLLQVKKNYLNNTRVNYKVKNAISVNGPSATLVYEEGYDEHIAVYGAHGSSFAVFEELMHQLTDISDTITVSPSPLCPDTLDAIAMEDAGVSFFDCGKICENKNIKAINAERFLNYAPLKKIKPELRLLSRLSEDTMNAAYKMLSKAKDAHFKLEDIYVCAMDFSIKERIENELFEKIFN